MPGLVKVGKTQRDPDARAQELSGATGIPTPFVVAYYEWFSDCTAAEDFVHTFLESKGCRVADNREFFSAPVKTVVQAILAAQSALGVAEDSEHSTISAMANGSEVGPESEPWEGLFADANEALAGLGDTIQDFQEAARLFEQAAKLGSLEACYKLSLLNRSDDYPDADARTALRWLNEGARRGYLPCYAGLATIYMEQGHNQNAWKCWAKYRAGYAGNKDDEYWKESFFLVLTAVEKKTEILDIHVLEDRKKIIGWAEAYVESHAKEGSAQVLGKEHICLVRNMLFPEEYPLVGGRVSWWDEEKGNGLVTAEDGRVAFFRLKQVVEGKLPPTPGQPAYFVPVEKPEHLFAYGVRLGC
jgi:cold shock CspA family protein